MYPGLVYLGFLKLSFTLVLDHTHPPRTVQLSHRAHIKPQTGSDSGWHAAFTVGSSTGQQCSLHVVDSRGNSDFYSCSAVPG